MNNEKEVVRRLRLTYGQALKDVDKNIQNLDMDINGIQATIDMFDDFGGSPEEKAQLQSMLQSKIYQKQYQQAIQGQLDDVMNKLHKNAYATVDEYLNDCYSEAFIGAAFDLHGQDVPLVMPMDQESIVRAVQLDSKINKGLYFHMGESVNNLKRDITTEVSRGLVNGSSYSQIAQQIRFKMVGTYDNPGGAMAYAMRIARTEGHRIQCQAAMDACYKAKDMGADIVKQWDSTMDGRTRSSHRHVDGEIRELDETFSNGLKYPGDPSCGAAEVVNCRCALLERAKWALDDDELQALKDRAKYFNLDKSDNFEDFKKNYLKAAEQSAVQSAVNAASFTPASSIEEAKRYANEQLGLFRVDYDEMPLDFANMLNKEVTSVYNTFGNLHEKGNLEAIIIWPKRVNWYAAYSSNSKLVGLKNVTSKSVLKKWEKDAAKQFASGFWSTNNAEHVIRHELGHAVQHMITDSDLGKLNRVQLLHKRLVNDLNIGSWSTMATEENIQKAGKHISYYALRNEGELIAESVAEYMSGSPRPVAKKVIEILTTDSMDFDLDEIMREIL